MDSEARIFWVSVLAICGNNVGCYKAVRYSCVPIYKPAEYWWADVTNVNNFNRNFNCRLFFTWFKRWTAEKDENLSFIFPISHHRIPPWAWLLYKVVNTKIVGSQNKTHGANSGRSARAPYASTRLKASGRINKYTTVSAELSILNAQLTESTIWCSHKQRR